MVFMQLGLPFRIGSYPHSMFCTLTVLSISTFDRNIGTIVYTILDQHRYEDNEHDTVKVKK